MGLIKLCINVAVLAHSSCIILIRFDNENNWCLKLMFPTRLTINYYVSILYNLLTSTQAYFFNILNTKNVGRRFIYLFI